MPKVVSRNVTAIAPDEVEELDPSKKLHLLYCLCGEFQLVLPGPLSALPIRPLDGARALRNSGPHKKTYKLTAQPIGDRGTGVLVRRGEAFEYQRPLSCARCELQIGYETQYGPKGDVTFILPGALSEVQNQIPADAFGPTSSPERTAPDTASSAAAEPAAEGQ